jgi:hypothetical protein
MDLFAAAIISDTALYFWRVVIDAKDGHALAEKVAREKREQPH